MSAQHTPGPWTARPGNTPIHGVEIWAEESNMKIAEQIRFSSINGMTAEEHDANGLLLAAAPELLDRAAALLAKIDNITTEQFRVGGERQEREALRELLRSLGVDA